MARKRLTREESRAQTRERLLETAEALFTKNGFEATSIEDVAETAGYSRGAFYSNFKSKDDLICAVLDVRSDRYAKEIENFFALNVSTAERLALLRAYYVQVASDRNGCIFWMAMQLYAWRHENVRPKVLAMLRHDRNAMADIVLRIFKDLGREPTAPPDSGINSCRWPGPENWRAG